MSEIFSKEVLRINAEAESDMICARIRELLTHTLHRRGIVVGLSGGIDSSVTAALAVRALGAKRVFGLHMPERESSPDTLQLSGEVARSLGIDTVLADITQMLEASGFYQSYQTAVRNVVPEFNSQWKSKLVSSGHEEWNGFTFFSLVAQSPSGELVRVRLPHRTYLEIVAATNFKQRIRKMIEYYHADRLHFAVAGTPNRLEYDQGFFVKNGDGSADIKPIAHLYKSQVYQLAEFLGVPESIRKRPPTTDTYSLGQGQDEFFFSVPIEQLDLCLYGKNHGIAPDEVAQAAELTPEAVHRVWQDIDRKRKTTRYLHLPPQLVSAVTEIVGL